MNVRVFIEIGSDGTFGAYIPEKNPLSIGVIGEGETFERAKQDFLNVVDAYRVGKVELPKNLNFVFRYDVSSFLLYYVKRICFIFLSRS